MEKSLKLSSVMESSLVSVVVISLLLCSTVVVEGIAAPTGAGSVAATPAPGPAETGVFPNGSYIVYTDRPEKFELKSIFPLFGGEQAARAAILYKYKGTGDYYGFSIKLTPEQVTAISKLPGVIQVVKSKNCNLQKKPYSAVH